MHRLLILACSRQKRSVAGLLPAVDRYDGPAYKVLRCYLRAAASKSTDIFILSARFGLISGDTLIPNYDQRMTSARALELQKQTSDELQRLHIDQRYKQVFVCAGALYRQALPWSTAAPQHVTMAQGGQGTQLSQLKAWLYPVSRFSYPEGTTAQNGAKAVHVRLRGRVFSIAPSEAVAVAENAAQNGLTKALRIATYYIPIGEQRIAPKWLVSKLTGLSSGAFHTGEALRVLDQLGIHTYATTLV